MKRFIVIAILTALGMVTSWTQQALAQGDPLTCGQCVADVPDGMVVSVTDATGVPCTVTYRVFGWNGACVQTDGGLCVESFQCRYILRGDGCPDGGCQGVIATVMDCVGNQWTLTSPCVLFPFLASGCNWFCSITVTLMVPSTGQQASQTRPLSCGPCPQT